jgi:hypothetical protein
LSRCQELIFTIENVLGILGSHKPHESSARRLQPCQILYSLIKVVWQHAIVEIFFTYHDSGIMYSNGTVAPNTKEYKNDRFTIKELKVESIPEKQWDFFLKNPFKCCDV